MTQLNQAAVCEDIVIDQVEPLSKSQSLEKGTYKYWQIRILYSMAFGYATFYLVRQNFSMAIPAISADLGYSKTQLGLIITIWSIIYGVGKFLNGYFSDRSNARYFMSLGLLGSALTSLVMGWGTSLYFFGAIWAFNAWFQSMGWPPVSRLLTHWFGPQELGTKWGITNLSHQIGGAIIAVLAGYLIQHYGWQSAFLIPSIIALGIALLLFNRLRDTPESLGLPSIEKHLNLVKGQEEINEENLPTNEILKRIFCNKLLWYVCLGNMFLYVVRMGVFNWAPTFLKELKGASLASSGWQVAAFEIAGMVGGVCAGWISDKIFSGRRGPVSFLYMLALIFCLVYFWFVPAGYDGLNAIAMTAVGFLVYGPQVLVGVAAADFASKKAVGMAVGLTGTFGYLGSALSGVCVGWIADQYGWDGGFIFFIVSAIMGASCFILTWRHRAKVLERA
jgi:phosphoglycerate transporter family protein